MLTRQQPARACKRAKTTPSVPTYKRKTEKSFEAIRRRLDVHIPVPDLLIGILEYDAEYYCHVLVLKYGSQVMKYCRPDLMPQFMKTYLKDIVLPWFMHFIHNWALRLNSVLFQDGLDAYDAKALDWSGLNIYKEERNFLHMIWHRHLDVYNWFMYNDLQTDDLPTDDVPLCDRGGCYAHILAHFTAMGLATPDGWLHQLPWESAAWQTKWHETNCDINIHMDDECMEMLYMIYGEGPIEMLQETNALFSTTARVTHLGYHNVARTRSIYLFVLHLQWHKLT